MRMLWVSLAMLAGCGVADFDIEQDVPEQRILGNSLPQPIGGLLSIPLDIDITAEIEAMDTGPVDSISLSELRLEITDTERPAGDTDTWEFVTSIQVFVRSTKPDSNLSRLEIATKEFPGAVERFNFTVDESIDLKPYIEEGAVVESVGRGNVPSDDVWYVGHAVFTVHTL